MKATFVFPNQLFDSSPAISRDKKIFIISDPLFFKDNKYPVSFHKSKILLHLLSINSYNKELLEKGYESQVIDYDQLHSIAYLESIIKENDISEVHYCNPVDYEINERLNKAFRKMNVNSKVYDSPSFLLNHATVIDEFSNKKTHFMASFYKKQRKHLNLLINEDGTPYGGKWSFDHENRKRLPKHMDLPPLKQFSYDSSSYDKMKIKVMNDFPSNPGEISSFNYPVTRKQAIDSFENFLEYRLENFGAYEDAIVKEESFLFHGVITPYLNIGLITPRQIIDKTLEFSKEFSVPLNSIEGFLRQIIGWREFIRGIYCVDGVRQRNSNFWNFENKIPSSFYDGSTGIEPIDKDEDKSHKILAFQILRASVKAYKNNLNTHKGYKEFREARAKLRQEEKKINGLELTKHLDRYAATGREYTKIIEKIIVQNDLTDFDNAKLLSTKSKKGVSL